VEAEEMKISKKKIKQLHDELVEIRTEQSENNSRIERRLGNITRKIFNLYLPPKKGYVRFETRGGYVQFKERRKSKKEGEK
jgi:hypothetical protein